MCDNKIYINVFIFLPSFRQVWFSSDDFAQNYRLSKRVTSMNPGHGKGVHDVNEVALYWLMSFAFREVHFLSKYSPKKSNGLLVPMYSLFPDQYYETMLVVLSSSRGSLIKVNVLSVSFGFDPLLP